MVFVKFHNMNRKKIFSYVAFKLKQPQNFSLYNKSKQCYNHSSKMFSFLFFSFNLCTDVLSILLKMSVLSFFFFHMLCSTMFKFLLLLFFSFRLFSIVLYVFVFVFILFSFFSFFFIINCSFNVPFFSTLYLPLCLYLNTITIGPLPSLFNFSR